MHTITKTINVSINYDCCFLGKLEFVILGNLKYIHSNQKGQIFIMAHVYTHIRTYLHANMYAQYIYIHIYV